MNSEYVVEYEYPHDWTNGGVLHFDTEETALEWAESAAKGQPGSKGYCKVTVYKQTLIRAVN